MHTFCEDMDASGNWICCDNDNTNWGGYVDDTPAAKDIYYGVVSLIRIIIHVMIYFMV